MKVEALKTISMGVVADIPPMHQPMDLFHRELPGLLLELLKHYCPAKHANRFHFNNSHNSSNTKMLMLFPIKKNSFCDATTYEVWNIVNLYSKTRKLCMHK
jgi:hypothetical protein